MKIKILFQWNSVNFSCDLINALQGQKPQRNKRDTSIHSLTIPWGSDFSFKVPYLRPFAAVKNEAGRNTIQRQTEGYNCSVNWVTYYEYLQITFEIWGHLRLLLAAL